MRVGMKPDLKQAKKLDLNPKGSTMVKIWISWVDRQIYLNHLSIINGQIAPSALSV